ncbi:MAG TPA: hypothetical protein VOA64_15500 [Candidatus Dormibacteraeota bacterium]|nr:hypothetical protein [Candidatus Dormibacteraeota bacterium]
MTALIDRQDNSVSTSVYRDWPVALGLSLATAILIVLPFFWLGNASGHDFAFHAASWIDVAGQWKEGIVFPRWAESANHGFGEPRFIFYPPLSWLLGAGLLFVAPWNHVPAILIVVVQTFAGLSAFALARKLVAKKRGAFFAAVLYAANPYALLLIYMRSDFAEQLAMAFFPLLVVAIFQITGTIENRSGSRQRAITFFAVMFAVIWLSNAPAGVLASYSAALLFVWAAVTQKSWRILGYGAGALALGFGLAGFYLVPAAYEQSWVKISQALSSGLLPSQNFLYATIEDPEHNLFNWIASSTAILMILLTGISAIAAHRITLLARADNRGSLSHSRAWSALFLLAAAATLLMLRRTSILWLVLPKLRFVQFPWRWMSILAVPFTCFLSIVVARRRLGWIWAVIILAVSAGAATWLIQHAWWDWDDIPVLQEGVARDEGYEGTDEYDPVGDDHYNLPERAPRVRVLRAVQPKSMAARATIRIDRWAAEEKKVRVTTPEPVQLALRLLNYPSWRVEVNGVALAPERPEDTNQMIVPVPAGESYVHVKFIRTLDRTLGGAMSILSVFILGALWFSGISKRG